MVPAGSTNTPLVPHCCNASSTVACRGEDVLVRPTGALDVQVLGDARPAQVGVDDDDTLAGLGEHDREVARGGGLALAGNRTGDGDRARRLRRR
jgi:hypothetical protein